MSFPKIPKDINISRDDAINLILKSIAMEEISLSKLIDAEYCKILHIINRPDICIQDILKINNSVDQTLKDISKLQMLLQYKLDNVNKLIPYCPCEEPCKPCAPVVCCCQNNQASKIYGKAEGKINDSFNEFYNNKAQIEFISDEKNCYENFVTYNISQCIKMRGIIKDIKISDNKIIFKGKGKCFKKKDKGNIKSEIKFVLFVQFCGCSINLFNIIIISKNKLLQHRSGFVTAECSELNICYNE